MMANHPNRRRARKITAAPTPGVSLGPTAGVARKAAKLAAASQQHEHEWSGLIESVRNSFGVSTMGQARLFTTDATGLWDIYLKTLPANERQIHNCNACRQFVERFGDLAVVDADGFVTSAMWTAGAPAPYDRAFQALRRAVMAAKVTGVFYSNDAIWGTPETGVYRHMAVPVPKSLRFVETLLTPGQAMAAARENFRVVGDAIESFKPKMLDEALRMLRNGLLDRAEKLQGPVEWLRQLHDVPRGPRWGNAIWRAVAHAPEGYCHPRSSVAGPLLEDIAQGAPFADIKRKHDAKVGALIYQRPQAAPTAGNLAAAEAVMRKMNLAPSLVRRFARLDDLRRAGIWWPKEVRSAAPSGGPVFGHIKPKGSRAPNPGGMKLPAVTMTWEKFKRTVMGTAERIEVRVLSIGPYIAMTAAMFDDAPPILKWDYPERRNTVAWYVYPQGSNCEQWGLSVGWAPVSGIVPLPPLWGPEPKPHLGNGDVLVIEGAVDKRHGRAGNALFPECLRDELHGIRATIEAHSRSEVLHGDDEASACGYDIRSNRADATLRVFAMGVWSEYKIDRWD